MATNPTPKSLKELNELISNDDFLSDKIAEKAGFLDPAEKVLKQLITTYAPIIETKKKVIKLSRLDISIPVLILGETGTGKELIARALHGARKGELVSINCGGIPNDLLEAEFFGALKGAYTGCSADRIGYVHKAKDGTLFLDEIGELPLFLQAKLLRVLEYKKFTRVGSTIEESANFRIVAATNRKHLDDAQNFRADLYYRIAGTVLELPPLSERGPEDIKLIVQHFVPDNEGLRQKILSDVLGKNLKGNVRQLLNIIDEHKVLYT